MSKTPALPRGSYALPGTSLNFKTGTWRAQKPVYRHIAAPCHTACPAGEDAQAYLALIAQENLKAAWESLIVANPLPAITGRVCDHPCESACNRGQFDAPIAIHNAERLLGDTALSESWVYPLPPPSAEVLPVAVVGAGPAGLSAAYHLLRLGYRPSLFDSLPQPGGTLLTALPAYRLPRHILEQETQRLLDCGIDFRPHTMLGRDVSLEELQHDFRAIFLGPGRQKSREWNVDGRIPTDLRTGLHLLHEWVAMGTVPKISSAAIVGGGNTAVDLARILRKTGSEVHLITHDALPGPAVPRGEAMAAIPREVEQAIEEGVIFHPHRGIRRLILRGEKVVGVEIVHMKKLAGADGKWSRVPFEGTETVLHVDQVIPAIGQEVQAQGMERILNSAAGFSADHWGQCGQPGVFSGGDARLGSLGTVTGAVGDGRRAALAIDRFLRGQPQPPVKAAAPLHFNKLNLHYHEHAPRAEESILPREQRNGCAEIAGGLPQQQVKHEADRCFSCGNCLACDNCWTLCPDNAVLKTKETASDGSHYVFDYDYCKGCGLCAHECPCGFIEMTEET